MHQVDEDAHVLVAEHDVILVVLRLDPLDEIAGRVGKRNERRERLGPRRRGLSVVQRLAERARQHAVVLLFLLEDDLLGDGAELVVPAVARQQFLHQLAARHDDSSKCRKTPWMMHSWGGPCLVRPQLRSLLFR